MMVKNGKKMLLKNLNITENYIIRFVTNIIFI